MSEENKAVIRRLVDGFWNEGEAEVIDEVYAADFVHHDPPPGGEQQDEERAAPGRR